MIICFRHKKPAYVIEDEITGLVLVECENCYQEMVDKWIKLCYNFGIDTGKPLREKPENENT